MFRSILPKEISFFDYFEQISTLAIECCNELLALTTKGGDMTAHVNRINDIEKDAHQCTDALHCTFITPMDRCHIHNLIQRLDDIIDSVDSATSRIHLYELTEIRPEARQLAEVLVKATIELDLSVKHLRNLKHPEGINEYLIRVYQLENEGDAILRAALSHIFKEETDAVSVIKWKEIFERLERATDRCEAVASIIHSIVIEAS